MSVYENVVGGTLKLKRKALDVKAGGIKKKKRKTKHHYDKESHTGKNELPAGGGTGLSIDHTEDPTEADKLDDHGDPPSYDDLLTPTERRYIERRQKIDVKRLAKISSKSHRDQIQEFNQYSANLSEHYDIPKVGPG